ncbi:hypothetical protein ONZ45_g17066 [Pleurotus djamor]|nr:hypothetical protein ONZ45_g17066 [Pleurotus djamor]
MAVKRKLELDADDVDRTTTKQLKLVPFPNYTPDNDVAMSDAEPMYLDAHHSRLSSTASFFSTASSSASDSPTSNSPFLRTKLPSLPASRPPSPTLDFCNPPAHSLTMGPTASKYQNSESHAPPVKMANEPCGASANNAALYPWSKAINCRIYDFH